MDANTLSTADLICEKLVHQVKNSKLNFSLFETPYSVNISLRKKLIKEFSTSNLANQVSSIIIDNREQKPVLVEENKVLKIEIKRLEAQKESDKEVIKVLECKIEQAESEVYRHLKEAKNAREVPEDAAVLKEVINNLNKVVARNKNELSNASKTIKCKDKEIHDLKNKGLNQQDTIKNSKEKIKDLKAENVQLEKEINTNKRKFEKKHSLKDKNKNVHNIEIETDPHPPVKANLIELAQICSSVTAQTAPLQTSAGTPAQTPATPQSCTANQALASDNSLLTSQSTATSTGTNIASPRNASGATPQFSSTSLKESPAVTSSSWVPFSKRIQCGKCDRKCMDNKDLEHHNLLWH